MRIKKVFANRKEYVFLSSNYQATVMVVRANQ